MAWYRVASHLGMPVGQLKCAVSYTEFLEWLEFLRWDEGRHTKFDYYMAQIATEVRRTILLHPGSVKVPDFLFNVKEEATAEEKEKILTSKKAWAGHLKIDLN